MEVKRETRIGNLVPREIAGTPGDSGPDALERGMRIRWLRKAAHDGHVPAMYQYAMHCDQPARRVRWLREAALEGYVPAMYHYALECCGAMRQRGWLRRGRGRPSCGHVCPGREKRRSPRGGALAVDCGPRGARGGDARPGADVRRCGRAPALAQRGRPQRLASRGRRVVRSRLLLSAAEAGGGGRRELERPQASSLTLRRLPWRGVHRFIPDVNNPR